MRGRGSSGGGTRFQRRTAMPLGEILCYHGYLMNKYQRILLIGAAVVLILTPSYYVHQELVNVIHVVVPTLLLWWALKGIGRK